MEKTAPALGDVEAESWEAYSSRHDPIIPAPANCSRFEPGVIIDIRAFPSLQDFIFECHPFRIVLLAPFVRGDWIGKNLEIIGVARKVPGIDVNPNGPHWSLLSLRFPNA